MKDINSDNFYRITFGSDEKTKTGDSLELAKTKHIEVFKDQIRVNSGGRVDPEKLSKYTIEAERQNIASVAEGEKNILKLLFCAALNLDKSIENTHQIIETIESLKNIEPRSKGGGFKIFNGKDIIRLHDAFKKLESVNERLVEFPDLFRQLVNPEDVTEEVNKNLSNKT